MWGKGGRGCSTSHSIGPFQKRQCGMAFDVCHSIYSTTRIYDAAADNSL